MVKKVSRTRAAKAEAQDAHYTTVRSAAETVVSILRERGISCAVFGSLACKLYGNSRSPKDVDLLVLQPPGSDHTAEALKELILVAKPRHFYLKLPRDPQATYRILWYRESYGGSDCKVDILIPGIMHLPPLTPERLMWIEDIPLVPFSLLLLHKLQGWDDHRKAEETYKQKRQSTDAADVRRMLNLKQEMVAIQASPPWGDSELFSEEFQSLTKERVKEYCTVFPDRVERWKSLGFATT